MRIALVHRRFTTHGGTERYLVNLTHYLVRAGHEVHVYCNEVRRDLKKDFQNVTFHYLPLLKLGGTLKDLSLCLGAHWLVPRNEYDIVQGFGRTLVQDVFRAGGGCHHIFYESLIAEAKPIQRFFLRLSTRHHLTLWIERVQYRPHNHRKIVAISNRVRNELVNRLGVDPKRVDVVYSGVDLERFHPDGRKRYRKALRANYGVPKDARVILFLGTGYRRKGLDVALKAFARIALDECRLMVTGKDTSESEYRQLAATLGIANRVIFCGPTREPEKYYAAADIFILPTRYEPFGQVCLEAMAAGLPVITTEISGAAEIFPEEACDLILKDSEDVQGFTTCLNRLLSDTRRIEYLGTVCRMKAEALTLESNGRQMEAIYRQVMVEKGGSCYASTR